MNHPIDLRSDTTTQPTDAMRRAMAAAEVGDDGYREDPTVNRLEAAAAERLGKAAGLFLPSGTMGNLVGVLTHGGPGGAVLLDQRSHILRVEQGGMAVVGGMFPVGLPAVRGSLNLAALSAALSTGIPRRIGPTVVAVENTHNDAGGAVVPLAHMAEVAKLAHAARAPIHLDGARIFNAAAALGVAAAEVARHADSVTFCLSKGLSAPAGSVLVGDADYIARARGWRKLLGGGMRQAGILAAAGLIALESMTGRLAEDHAHARRLAAGLAEFDPALAGADAVPTNIVMFDVGASGRPAEWWSDRLKQSGVLANINTPQRLRFVTHRHIGAAEADKSAEIIGRIWQSARSA
jgi:threonine aldolase